MSVINCSTAANYFHFLRMHMRSNFRKPVAVIAPKKLLRFKGACSSAEDFCEGSRFKRLIEDTNEKLAAADKVRKVILCSGQVYFDLEARREAEKKHDIAILRVESLCPFPFKEIVS